MALYALSAGGADAASETAIFKEIVMIVASSAVCEKLASNDDFEIVVR